MKIEIPNALSYLAFLDPNAYVPGISDLVHGNEKQNIPSYQEKINSGKKSIDALAAYKKAKKEGNKTEAQFQLKIFEEHFENFGYGYYFGKDPHLLVPNVKTSFYSFHIMVILGGFFMLLFMLLVYFMYKNKLPQMKWLLWVAVWSIPLVYIASESGWVVAEVGRQPWVIQDLMPTIAAVSRIDAYAVQTTFFMFLIVFTLLLIAEIKIMLNQIKKGSQH